MVYRDEQVACITCHVPMVRTQEDDYHLWRCAQCHGVWLDRAGTQQLLGRLGKGGVPLELVQHNDGTERRPCPMCRELMEIAWYEFLQLDQCDAHGLWFDSEELAHALDGRVILDGLPKPRLSKEEEEELRRRRDAMF